MRARTLSWKSLVGRAGVAVFLLAPALQLMSVPAASASATWSETTGGLAHTWTNYVNAGGSQGASVAAFATVQITCATNGFKVADGNTWWYQIASSPWNNTYYVSADAFYNNGATSGPLKGTPFVDPAVPQCVAAAGVPETTGGVTNTWSDYLTAGGTAGQQIPLNFTVKVTCKIIGFRVADGNTWWYQVASAPWGNSFYASADAFYNNGETSGPLAGTPFVDTNVPSCAGVKVGTVAASEGAVGTSSYCTVADCHFIVLSLTGWRPNKVYTVWFDTDCAHNEPACGTKHHYASTTLTTDSLGGWSGNTRLFGYATSKVWVTVQGVQSNQALWS